MRRVPGILVALFVGLLGACSAPTLPLPPPDTEVGAPNELGIVEVQGSGAESHSLCICINEETEGVAGAYSSDAGDFVMSIEAEVGHTITCWYEVGFDRSQPRSTPVPAPN